MKGVMKGSDNRQLSIGNGRAVSDIPADNYRYLQAKLSIVGPSYGRLYLSLCGYN